MFAEKRDYVLPPGGVGSKTTCVPGRRRPLGVAEEAFEAGSWCALPPLIIAQPKEEHHAVTTALHPGRVVIAIDPHKASWTAPPSTPRCNLGTSSGSTSAQKVTGGCGGSLGTGATPAGPSKAHRAGRHTDPAATRRRNQRDRRARQTCRPGTVLSGHGRKTDEADAVSAGIAALTASRLHTASVDAAITALRAVVEHRKDLVKPRTQTVNRSTPC